MKKYEFTGETKELSDGTIVKRIRALKTFESQLGMICPGDLGGWIESEDNLSHDGRCWVGGKAAVYNSAAVRHDAVVCDHAIVRDHACVLGFAQIRGMAMACGHAQINREAQIKDCVLLYEHAFVSDFAKISGQTSVGGYVTVRGNATVAGFVNLLGAAHLTFDACVNHDTHYLSVGPFWHGADYITFYRNKAGIIKMYSEDFNGTIDEFISKVQKEHGNDKYAQTYRAACLLAKLHIDTTPIE